MVDPSILFWEKFGWILPIPRPELCPWKRPSLTTLSSYTAWLPLGFTNGEPADVQGSSPGLRISPTFPARLQLDTLCSSLPICRTLLARLHKIPSCRSTHTQREHRGVFPVQGASPGHRPLQVICEWQTSLPYSKVSHFLDADGQVENAFHPSLQTLCVILVSGDPFKYFITEITRELCVLNTWYVTIIKSEFPLPLFVCL